MCESGQYQTQFSFGVSVLANVALGEAEATKPRLSQPSSAPVPTVTLSVAPMNSPCSELHPANAYAPMEVTLEPRFTHVRSVSPAKAYGAIASTSIEVPSSSVTVPLKLWANPWSERSVTVLPSL